MTYRQVTAPIEEPVTLAEAKASLRVDHDFEDALISALIASARNKVETDTERQLVTASWHLLRDGWPKASAITIAIPKVQAITAVQYMDSNGESQTLAPSNYFVDPHAEPGRLILKSGVVWPAISNQPNAITIRFTAGYGDASAVPEVAKQAIKLLVGHWFYNREAASDRRITAVEMAYESLIDSLRWRRHVLIEDADEIIRGSGTPSSSESATNSMTETVTINLIAEQWVSIPADQVHHITTIHDWRIRDSSGRDLTHTSETDFDGGHDLKIRSLSDVPNLTVSLEGV